MKCSGKLALGTHQMDISRSRNDNKGVEEDPIGRGSIWVFIKVPPVPCAMEDVPFFFSTDMVFDARPVSCDQSHLLNA